VITDLSFGIGGRYQWTDDLSLAGAFTFAPQAKMVQEGTYIGQSPVDGSFYPGRYRHETKLMVGSATFGVQQDF